MGLFGFDEQAFELILEVWTKPLVSTMSGRVAVVVLNRSEQAKSFGFQLEDVGIDAGKGYTLRDLWQKTDLPVSFEDQLSFEVAVHGVMGVQINRTSLPFHCCPK